MAREPVSPIVKAVDAFVALPAGQQQACLDLLKEHLRRNGAKEAAAGSSKPKRTWSRRKKVAAAAPEATPEAAPKKRGRKPKVKVEEDQKAPPAGYDEPQEDTDVVSGPGGDE